MMVEVQLWAHLVEYAPQGQKAFNLKLDSGTTIGMLLSILEISPEIPKVILVNGHQAKAEMSLTDGDEVVIFPPAAGG
jgi:molybdopterin converting factor small subunit